MDRRGVEADYRHLFISCVGQISNEARMEREHNPVRRHAHLGSVFLCDHQIKIDSSLLNLIDAFQDATGRWESRLLTEKDVVASSAHGAQVMRLSRLII